MNRIYKSAEGERLIRERYLAFLKHWPVPNQQIRIPTNQGETFVVAAGAEAAPPLLLLHGGATNSSMWMGDIRAFASSFRVYATRLDRRARPERAFAPSALLGGVRALAR